MKFASESILAQIEGQSEKLLRLALNGKCLKHEKPIKAKPSELGVFYQHSNEIEETYSGQNFDKLKKEALASYLLAGERKCLQEAEHRHRNIPLLEETTQVDSLIKVRDTLMQDIMQLRKHFEEKNNKLHTLYKDCALLQEENRKLLKHGPKMQAGAEESAEIEYLEQLLATMKIELLDYYTP
mmetsp:Transcript_11745/g.13518  ORF Transcript_11745/g.13518 Transcript_11745/m.13518 type:complete len:183 (+) Transcript_11745:171-719(+)